MRQELIDFLYWLNENKALSMLHHYGEEDVDEYLGEKVKSVHSQDVPETCWASNCNGYIVDGQCENCGR